MENRTDARPAALRLPARQRTERHAVYRRHLRRDQARLAAPHRSGRWIHPEAHVHLLVWFELHATMESAIAREKTIKAWKRLWKIELIEKANPDWRDLYPDII